MRRRSILDRLAGLVGARRGTVLALAVAVLAVVLVWIPGARSTEATVYFASTNGIYAGDEVRILGVPVGKITSITPERDRVKVVFDIDHGIKVPADAGAVIVAPSLVSSRYLQLAPRYTGGPVLQDGAVIPESRTAVPVEWDQIKEQLNTLAVALGPNGANKTGALSRLVQSSSTALEGEGPTISSTIANMSRAVQALQNGSGDAFATVKNLQVFVGALAESDQQISEFTARLDSVSGLLVDDKQSIRTGLANLATAVGKVERFVNANRANLKRNILGLTDVTQVVAKEQESLAQTLQVAPNALANLISAVHQRQNAVAVDLNGANIHSPGQLICGAIGGASETSGVPLGNLCQSVLGKVLDQAAGNPTTTSFIGLLEKILGIQ